MVGRVLISSQFKIISVYSVSQMLMSTLHVKWVVSPSDPGVSS